MMRISIICSYVSSFFSYYYYYHFRCVLVFLSRKKMKEDMLFFLLLVFVCFFKYSLCLFHYARVASCANTTELFYLLSNVNIFFSKKRKNLKDYEHLIVFLNSKLYQQMMMNKLHFRVILI
jgi:O-antigen/teichoic acid export membrane protein